MAKKTGKPTNQDEDDVGERQLWNDWRIWLLGIALLISLFALSPHYTQADDGTTQLSTDIKKGLDLKGGTRLLLKPQENVTDQQLQQIITTLQARVNAFGLAEITIRPVQSLEQNLIQVEAAGTDPDQLTRLIAQQGRFEARFQTQVSGNDTLTLGTETHPVQVTETGITVNSNTYTENDQFTLHSGEQGGNISITVMNHTAHTATLGILGFDGSAIQEVVQSAQTSRFNCNPNGCQYQFQVVVSQQGANQFHAAAQALHVVGAGQNARLSSNIHFYLDNNETDSLSVSAEFKDNPITTPQISGGADTEDAALQERKQLQSMLQSGALPVPIEIVSTSTVSAALGQQFTRIAITAILVAVLGVAAVLYARYQDLSITGPIALTGFSEVFILLGLFSNLEIGFTHVAAVLTLSGVGAYFCYKHDFASIFYIPLGSLLTLTVLSINPTLDLPAIAGIIAAVGTGVDDQIVMADEGRSQKLRDFWDRIKRAFFIIFTAAASTIGAMIPLYFVGAGALRGFAITTIVGVLIGIFITRPAYAQILAHFHDDYER